VQSNLQVTMYLTYFMFCVYRPRTAVRNLLYRFCTRRKYNHVAMSSCVSHPVCNDLGGTTWRLCKFTVVLCL